MIKWICDLSGYDPVEIDMARIAAKVKLRETEAARRHSEKIVQVITTAVCERPKKRK